ncbi:MAG: radical SAM protein [bacterium]|nr:radical SAM protein [bacterium]
MNIALVFPRLHSPSGDPPLGLGYLASNLPPALRDRVTLVDGTFMRSAEEFHAAIGAARPGVAGIFFDTMSFERGIAAARRARGLGAFVVAGGPHATVLPETLLDDVDVVALGEAERTFVEIVERAPSRDLGGIRGICYREGGRIVTTEPREPIADLDSIRFPERRLFDMESYMASWHYLDILGTDIRGTTVVASRGCPFRCTYCQPTLNRIFGKRLRLRSPANIVEEITSLKEEYGVRGIFFHDDTLTAHKGWLGELCDRLIAARLDILWACNARADLTDDAMLRRMYRAGVRYLHVGAESGSQRILDEVYRKRIRLENIRRTVAAAQRAGIRAGCFFMLGAPTETREELRETIRFAAALDIDEATFNITTPLPGTYLHDMVRGLNYRISTNYADFNYYSKRAFEDPNLPARTLKRYQKMALFSFYLKPRRWRYIMRHLLTPSGIRKLMVKMRRFFR